MHKEKLGPGPIQLAYKKDIGMNGSLISSFRKIISVCKLTFGKATLMAVILLVLN
jgi:hypothetical protein